MESKKRNAFRLIFLSLVLLNIFVVLFLFSNRPNEDLGYKSIIEDNLNFTENQIKEYHRLIHSHQKSLRIISRNIRKAKFELYSELNKTKSNQLLIDQKTNRLNQFQKELEVLNFNHFLSIKKICNQNQLVEFKKISKEFTHFFKE